jgi:hypothetical protein
MRSRPDSISEDAAVRRLAAVSLLSLAGCSTAPIADVLDWMKPAAVDPSRAPVRPIVDPAFPPPGVTEHPLLGPVLPPMPPAVIDSAPLPQTPALPPSAPPPNWPG